MAVLAETAGDGQQRHHVAEAAAHFPSHQNLGHGPIPGCRLRRGSMPVGAGGAATGRHRLKRRPLAEPFFRFAIGHLFVRKITYTYKYKI